MFARWSTAFAAGVIALAGCTADEPVDEDDREVAGNDPIPSVTIPAARLTPFCQAMIDLSDRLEADPPETTAETTRLILDTYEGVADQVPAAIEVEFAAVLARLRGEEVVPSTATDEDGATIAPEGDDFFEEGYSPDDDPSLRVNEYVDFACRDSVNNPGPPPTQPLEDIVIDDPDGA